MFVTMTSPPRSTGDESAASSPLMEHPAADDTITLPEPGKQTEEQAQQDKDKNRRRSHSLSPPAEVPPFDWDDFEARYEKALQVADEHEKEILKEAEGLSKVIRAASQYQLCLTFQIVLPSLGNSCLCA